LSSAARSANSTSMNRRHTVTFALVGWYLMSPLVDHSQGKILYEAPLAYWEIEESFDTATECRRHREENIKLMSQIELKAYKQSEKEQERYEAQEDAESNWPKGTARKSRGMGMKSALSALCIATDDPRLKGK
jgi:hypothetical protein